MLGGWGGGSRPGLPPLTGGLPQSHLSEEQKMKFLESVCSVCTTAREKGLSAGLDCFCRRTDVARHIEVRRG